MSIDQKMQQVLQDIAPVFPNAYKGTLDRYIVYNYSITPSLFSDDCPHADVLDLHIHFFCPIAYNPLADLKEIRKRLVSAGIGYTTSVNATDNEYQHYVLECECMEEIAYTEKTKKEVRKNG